MTACYTDKEGQCICKSLVAINQNPIYGAEQKDNFIFIERKVTQDFHERRRLAPFCIHIGHGQVPIQKKWG
jgi:hypothetical protein